MTLGSCSLLVALATSLMRSSYALDVGLITAKPLARG